MTQVLDEFEQLLEESFAKSNSVADIVEGTVIKKETEGYLVSVKGAKMEAFLSNKELSSENARNLLTFFSFYCIINVYKHFCCRFCVRGWAAAFPDTSKFIFVSVLVLLAEWRAYFAALVVLTVTSTTLTDDVFAGHASTYSSQSRKAIMVR